MVAERGREVGRGVEGPLKVSGLDPGNDMEGSRRRATLYKSHSDPEAGGMEQNTGGKEKR